MKARFNFLFVAAIGCVFLGFVGFLEANKGKAGFGVFKNQESALMNRWIVAEAVDPVSNINLEDDFRALSWQFLQNGGFVRFEEQIIDKTGEWRLKGQELTIREEGKAETKKFYIEKLTQRELLLSGTDIKIRLLRFDD